MKTLLQWLVVAILIIVGVPAITQSLLGGLFLLVAAALTAPPVWNEIHARTEFSYRGIVIAALGLAGMAACLNSPEFQKGAAEHRAKREARQDAGQTVSSSPRSQPQAIAAEETNSVVKANDLTGREDTSYRTDQLADYPDNPAHIVFRDAKIICPIVLRNIEARGGRNSAIDVLSFAVERKYSRSDTKSLLQLCSLQAQALLSE